MKANLLSLQIPRKRTMPLHERTTQENKGIDQEVGTEGSWVRAFILVSTGRNRQMRVNGFKSG